MWVYNGNRMAKWLPKLYVCNQEGNYTTVANTKGSIVKCTHCLLVRTTSLHSCK